MLTKCQWSISLYWIRSLSFTLVVHLNDDHFAIFLLSKSIFGTNALAIMSLYNNMAHMNNKANPEHFGGMHIKTIWSRNMVIHASFSCFGKNSFKDPRRYTDLIDPHNDMVIYMIQYKCASPRKVQLHQAVSKHGYLEIRIYCIQYSSSQPPILILDCLCTIVTIPSWSKFKNQHTSPI